jgi:hypothetical protein
MPWSARCCPARSGPTGRRCCRRFRMRSRRPCSAAVRTRGGSARGRSSTAAPPRRRPRASASHADPAGSPGPRHSARPTIRPAPPTACSRPDGIGTTSPDRPRGAIRSAPTIQSLRLSFMRDASPAPPARCARHARASGVSSPMTVAPPANCSASASASPVNCVAQPRRRVGAPVGQQRLDPAARRRPDRRRPRRPERRRSPERAGGGPGDPAAHRTAPPRPRRQQARRGRRGRIAHDTLLGTAAERTWSPIEAAPGRQPALAAPRAAGGRRWGIHRSPRSLGTAASLATPRGPPPPGSQRKRSGTR